MSQFYFPFTISRLHPVWVPQVASAHAQQVPRVQQVSPSHINTPCRNMNSILSPPNYNGTSVQKATSDSYRSLDIQSPIPGSRLDDGQDI